MQKFFLVVIFFSSVAALWQWRKISYAEKLLAILLVLSLATEVICYVLNERRISVAPVHYWFSIGEIVLTTLFFIEVNKMKSKRLWIIVTTAIWLLIGLINISRNSHDHLNTNFLLLESFCIIIMSLYTLFNFLKSETEVQILRNTSFLFVCTQLLLWSGSFLFWGMGIYLIKQGWNAESIKQYHLILNILVYFSMLSIFSFYDQIKYA